MTPRDERVAELIRKWRVSERLTLTTTCANELESALTTPADEGGAEAVAWLLTRSDGTTHLMPADTVDPRFVNACAGAGRTICPLYLHPAAQVKVPEARPEPLLGVGPREEYADAVARVAGWNAHRAESLRLRGGDVSDSARLDYMAARGFLVRRLRDSDQFITLDEGGYSVTGEAFDTAREAIDDAMRTYPPTQEPRA